MGRCEESITVQRYRWPGGRLRHWRSLVSRRRRRWSKATAATRPHKRDGKFGRLWQIWHLLGHKNKLSELTELAFRLGKSTLKVQETYVPVHSNTLISKCSRRSPVAEDYPFLIALFTFPVVQREWFHNLELNPSSTPIQAPRPSSAMT